VAASESRNPVTDWSTDFDPFDPQLTSDPYPIYEDLRSRCPVAHSDRYNGITVLTKYADISQAVHDPETFSSERIVINDLPTHQPGLVLPPINMDPPDQTDWRRLLLPFFSPRAVEAWRPQITEICGDLLEGLKGRTEFDAAVEYAQELPGEITVRMLGVESEQAPLFRSWLHDLLEIGPTDVAVAAKTTGLMLDYLGKLLDRRRHEPGAGDMASYLLTQTIDGEPIPHDEMARILFLILIAGIDTTWSAIGFVLLHLATHDQDRRRLAQDRSLIPTAVEEALRMYSPVFVARVTKADTEIGQCPVGAGQWALLAFASANRDPDMFEQADEFIIDRKANRHSAFGLGVHRCLGSNLARVEMQIAIEMWMEAFPEFTLADPHSVTYSTGHVRGPRRVPIKIAGNH